MWIGGTLHGLSITRVPDGVKGPSLTSSLDLAAVLSDQALAMLFGQSSPEPILHHSDELLGPGEGHLSVSLVDR
jgi:hypothetical protein